MNTQKYDTFPSKLYTSRSILLDILEERGYDVNEWKYFGINRNANFNE